MVTPRLCGTLSKIIFQKSSTTILPDHISPTDLANTFENFSVTKLWKSELQQSSVPVSLTRPRSNNSAISSFEPVSEGNILKILNSSPTKSCDLDLIPTSLVKECTDILVTPITNIINYSLKERSFTNCFKITYVAPFSRNIT